MEFLLQHQQIAYTHDKQDSFVVGKSDHFVSTFAVKCARLTSF